MLSVPPLMVAPTRSSVDPLSTDTVPPVLVTTVEVSFSVLSSIACSVPVLVTGSPVMSSSPPFASSVPKLVMVTSTAGSMVSTTCRLDQAVVGDVDIGEGADANRIERAADAECSADDGGAVKRRLGSAVDRNDAAGVGDIDLNIERAAGMTSIVPEFVMVL